MILNALLYQEVCCHVIEIECLLVGVPNIQAPFLQASGVAEVEAGSVRNTGSEHVVKA